MYKQETLPASLCLCTRHSIPFDNADIECNCRPHPVLVAHEANERVPRACAVPCLTRGTELRVCHQHHHGHRWHAAQTSSQCRRHPLPESSSKYAPGRLSTQRTSNASASSSRRSLPGTYPQVRVHGCPSLHTHFVNRSLAASNHVPWAL